MKIKELHLRNIASIEKADIDFESCLNDIVNGSPASIFLISGDTGAGKSVILDGISMALYKKTPRIIDVQNKTNNNFTDDQGDSISINSIEQYTRLGISYKDECYSEVAFEGNDGKEYHAKLELGLTKSNKKDKDGNYLIKHSTPVWTVKVGSDDWQKVEAKTGQPILDAVGLTFEQFGRMAMLAQGQFASFLTGDKKERESILEQLTNTEHFTAYGEAIKRLFDNAKTAQKTAQTAFDTEKEHTLPSEQVEQHNTDLDELKIKEKDCKQQIDCVDKKIKAVEQIELSSKAKHTSEDAMRSLEERRENIIRTLENEAKQSGEIFKTQQIQIAEEQIEKAKKELFSDYEKAKEDAKQTYLETLSDMVTNVMSEYGIKSKELEEVLVKLEEAHAKADAAVKVNKRAEMEKQQKDFYRIQLSPEDLEEIKRLREVEQYLRQKEPLNKVIYKCYYEKPLTSMIGRVLGNRKITGIYKITNLDNGMCYIGQSVDVADRWRQHVKRGVGAEPVTQNKLYPAMKSIGVENFMFELIEECKGNELTPREKYWTDFYQAQTYGYTVKKG